MGLYKGLIPSTCRGLVGAKLFDLLPSFITVQNSGAFIAVGELATYDHAKSTIKKHLGMGESLMLHAICSLITGMVATTVAAPFDLLKTR